MATSEQHDVAIRKAERELFADEIIAKIQKRIDGIIEAFRNETNERITERPYAVVLGMDESIKMIQSLRTEANKE